MNWCPDDDPRFRSGLWRGYYTQPDTGSLRHSTEATLTFFAGQIEGRGQDVVGEFELIGEYRTEDGACFWVKQYKGRHNILYKGYAEDDHISGRWEIRPNWYGQFQLRYVGPP